MVSLPQRRLTVINLSLLKTWRYWGNWDILQLILKLSARFKLMFSFMHRPLYPGEITPVTDYTGEFMDLRARWKLWRMAKSLALTGNRIPVRTPHSIATVPTVILAPWGCIGKAIEWTCCVELARLVGWFVGWLGSYLLIQSDNYVRS
jgi:hypothetical protein